MMKKLIVGGLPALVIGLAGAPVAGADPDCCEHEFDWATPYYEAFERHGIAYLSVEMAFPYSMRLISSATEKHHGKVFEALRSTGVVAN